VLDEDIGNTLDQWKKLNRNEKLMLLKLLIITNDELWNIIKPLVAAKIKQK